MTRSAQPPSSLPRLRTIAGRSDKPDSAHKAFLRVSFLELQRSRLTTEMELVRRRLAGMEVRCAEIEAEKARILSGLGPAPPEGSGVAGPRAGPSGKRPGKSFRMSY